MECREKGTLSGSYYFFFSPSETTKSLFFYPVWVGHYYCDSDYCIHRDTFPLMLLAYVHAGAFHIEYRGRTVTACRGDLVLLDCNEPHLYRADGALEFSYVHFEGQNARALVQHLTENDFIFHGADADRAERILRDLLNVYQYNQPIRDARCSAMLYNMLIELEGPAEITAGDDSPMKHAMAYIQQHCREKLTLEDVARQVNLSPFHFSRVFKQYAGCAPMEYAQKIRMDMAKCLLKTTELPIEQIAERVGYGSASSFANMFTQKVGLSPTQFRKFPI